MAFHEKRNGRSFSTSGDPQDPASAATFKIYQQLNTSYDRVLGRQRKHKIRVLGGPFMDTEHVKMQRRCYYVHLRSARDNARPLAQFRLALSSGPIILTRGAAMTVLAPSSLGRDGRQQDPKLTTMVAKLTRDGNNTIAYGQAVKSLSLPKNNHAVVYSCSSS